MPSITLIEHNIAPYTTSAARRVYDLVEIRRKIFTLLDRDDLIMLFRVCKGITVSVADVTYQHMISSEKDVKENFIAIPRRFPHFAAIRRIDASLPAYLFVEEETADILEECMWKSPGKRLNPFSSRFKQLMNLFPNVQKIYWLNPTEEREDVGVIHLSYKGGRNEVDVVEIESTIMVDIDTKSNPFDDPPFLPEPPSFPNVRVIHTICLRFVNAEPDGHEYPWGKFPVEREKLLKEWGRWLRCASDLDRRISGFELSHVLPRTWAQISLKEWCTFLTERSRDGCAPWTMISLEADDKGTIAQMIQLASQLGSHLRCLKLDVKAIAIAGGLQDAITLFDASCPSLRQLDVTFAYHQMSGPLFGLPDLHLLIIKEFYTTLIEASDVYLMGSMTCVIRDGNVKSEQAAIALQKHVERLRSYRL